MQHAPSIIIMTAAYRGLLLARRVWVYYWTPPYTQINSSTTSKLFKTQDGQSCYECCWVKTRREMKQVCITGQSPPQSVATWIPRPRISKVWGVQWWVLVFCYCFFGTTISASNLKALSPARISGMLRWQVCSHSTWPGFKIFLLNLKSLNMTTY